MAWRGDSPFDGSVAADETIMFHDGDGLRVHSYTAVVKAFAKVAPQTPP